MEFIPIREEAIVTWFVVVIVCDGRFSLLGVFGSCVDIVIRVGIIVILTVLGAVVIWGSIVIAGVVCYGIIIIICIIILLSVVGAIAIWGTIYKEAYWWRSCSSVTLPVILKIIVVLISSVISSIPIMTLILIDDKFIKLIIDMIFNQYNSNTYKLSIYIW